MASQIRLAYLLSEYPALSHTFVLREVKRLRAMNFDIRVASINSPKRPPAEMTAEEREEAATTFYVKRAGARGALIAHLNLIARRPAAYMRGLWSALRLGGTDLRRVVFSIFYFVEAVILGRWMESLQVQHLHVHFANQAATVGLIASRVFPIGFSITVHGPDEFFDAPGCLLKEKIARASFICCIGYFARSQLMRLAPPSQWSKLEVAPLGVDTSVFTPRPLRPAAAPFEILCVGRLVPAKGQHVLLGAVDYLVKAKRSVRLRLVGDGPDRESLAREAVNRGLGPHVIFEGGVNHDRIREFYAAADAFVLASFAEGVPTVLMEAMAMGIACVATFVNGIPELIRNEVDGILVAPADDRALSRAIERLIDDPELRGRLGDAGRRRVVDEYNLDRNAARLAQIFASRVGGGRQLCAS